MNAQTETVIAKRNPTGWQKLLTWLKAFEEALDYDPREQANGNIRGLQDEVKQLNARLEEIEGRNQRGA